MKKIAFFLPAMLCGGLEKSLLGLIGEFPEDNYRVTVYFINATGSFLPLLPKKNFGGELKLSPQVREDLGHGGIRATFKYRLSHGQFGKAMQMAWRIIRNDPNVALTVPFEQIEELPGHYDVAVCYQMHSPFLVRYVIEKVNANKKFVWLHSEVSNGLFRFKSLMPWLRQYNHIFAVSEELRDKFVALSPELRDKTTVAHNIVSESEIRNALDNQAVPEYPDDGTLKLLTVGRLSMEKGYDLAIQACAKLKEQGLRFQWFAMGSGGEEDALRRMITERHLEETFVLIGTRLNPYPYIDQCDIYVQPSRYEGYGIAVAEARTLYKPIVCTDFNGAREQLTNKKTGSIVRFDSNELTEALAELIKNPGLRQLYSENLKKAMDIQQNEIDELMGFFGLENHKCAII